MLEESHRSRLLRTQIVKNILLDRSDLPKYFIAPNGFVSFFHIELFIPYVVGSATKFDEKMF